MKVLLSDLLSHFTLEIERVLDEVIVRAKPEDIVEVCRTCKEDPVLAMDYLRCLVVVDYVDYLQLVYLFSSIEKGHKFIIKTNLSLDHPVVPSIVGVYPGADWHEREGAELFGVTFSGHPNPQHLLLYDGFEGYPGRKSYPFHEYEEW